MQWSNKKYISLRTFRKTGEGVDTPVWFASTNDSMHYVFSTGGAGKVKRLRNSSKAQINICDFRGGILGTWLDCRAYLVDNPGELNRAHERFVCKYGWTMRITDYLSWLSGRLNRRVYIRIEV